MTETERLRAALRSWLIEQSAEAHRAADHPDGQPGDPGGYFDKGAAHMADATLTKLAELVVTQSQSLATPTTAAEGLDVERLRADIEEEMAGRYNEVADASFIDGAMAAYHFVLSRLVARGTR